MFTLDDLVYAVPLAWNEDTATSSLGKHPAEGQDLVTAMLVKKHCGGVVLYCEAGGEYNRDPHYLNELEGGVRIDLTAGRFRKQTPIRKFKAIKDPILPHSTIDKIELLERRVEEALAWR